MRILGWLACVTVSMLGVLGWSAAAAGSEDGAVRLTFRERPHVVMHAWARAVVEQNDAERAHVEGFETLVEAGQALQRALGDARLWGMIDARIVGAGSATDVVAAMEALPPEARMRDGSARAFRGEAIAYAKSLQSVTAAFEEDGWGELRAALEATARDIDAMLAGARPDPMGWIVREMAWRVPEGGIEVPVDLAWAAPSPGGVTFRVAGGAACMVGVEGIEGPTRAEVVLHEAMHAVDVMTGGMGGTKRAPEARAAGHDDALSRLRTAMAAAGIDPRSRLAHDAWHTLFFITAGEAVRRCIDPDYVDYAVVRTYYERVGPIADAERRAWAAYLGGEIGMNEAIDEIVSGAKEIEDAGE